MRVSMWERFENELVASPKDVFRFLSGLTGSELRLIDAAALASVNIYPSILILFAHFSINCDGYQQVAAELKQIAQAECTEERWKLILAKFAAFNAGTIQKDEHGLWDLPG